MVAWVHPGLRRIGKSQDIGGSRCSEPWSFRGPQKQSAAAHPGFDPSFIGNRRLTRPSACRVVALRQTFVRRCHGGLRLLHFEPACPQKSPAHLPEARGPVRWM